MLSSSTSVISRFAVQPCDVPIGHRSRRGTYMIQIGARGHPMKMVGRPMQGFASGFEVP
jgi:hypothetical protein